MREFISVREALDIVLSTTTPVDTEETLLQDSLGLTLAEEIHSSVDIPPFDNSAMDGYAVRSIDVANAPTTLPISMHLPAGSYPDTRLEPGTCASIMTGAPLPPGADSIIPVEWAKESREDRVTFSRPAIHGYSIRSRGEDVQQGTSIFDAGTIITPPVIGMIASLGIPNVRVCRRPRFAVVTTGNELVHHWESPANGQIRNSNGPALAAQITACGGVALHSSTARDTEASLSKTIEDVFDHVDVVVLSGGVSVGEFDLVQDVLRDLGVEILFWKVRQRPGKPLLFGVSGGRLVFGLPGNPVSSAVCFDQYVRPACARMLGRQRFVRVRELAALVESVNKVKGLHYFARGVTSRNEQGLLSVRSTGPQGSAVYSSMARADCIIHLPEDMEHPEPGTPVEIERLDWF